MLSGILSNYKEDVAMMYLIYEGRVGEYVRYVAGKKVFPVKPSVSGIQDVQYVKTVRTKRWRIYRKEGDVLELISDEPVAVISVYGVRGFSNIIYMANSISNAFIDNKYAFSARSIGCSDESIEKLRFSTNIMTLKDAWQNNYSDPFYLADFSRINRYRLLTCSDTPILLASRQVEKIGRKMCFCIRTMCL